VGGTFEDSWRKATGQQLALGLEKRAACSIKEKLRATERVITQGREGKSKQPMSVEKIVSTRKKGDWKETFQEKIS